MAIPTTYTNLVSAVQEELEDTGTEFVAYIPTAIRLAEQRINKDLDGIYSIAVTTVAMAAGNPVLSKPTGYRLGYDLTINVDGVTRILLKTTRDFLKDYWPVQTSVAQPKYYADFSTSAVEIAPTPDGPYNATFRYAKYPDFLGDSNQTNVIIDKYSDLLFYATLKEQARFNRMFEAAQLYEQNYQQSLARTQEETRRERADNSFVSYTNYITQNRMNKQE